MIDASDVAAARRRIQASIRTTPLVQGEPFATYLKLELAQHTGSFKTRGAFNRILTAAEQGVLPGAGVVAASGGNAALGVAYAAVNCGTRARVVVPRTAPAVKVRKLRELGAEIDQVGTRYHDAYQAAIRYAEDTGALFCHAYDQPEICAGQGTLGTEILEQTDGQVDTILVAVGGGGLMAGIAAATGGEARVVGVEPAACPTFSAALAAGKPVEVEVSGVAADSLGATLLGRIAYDVATRAGVQSVLVDESDILAARKLLWENKRIVVEHGAAVALAALTSGAYTPQPGERVAVVLSGGNTDPADLT
ncbi:threonine/serine dehydratase [Kibdelosporangium phytohabitans]|uniref:Threonine dehydratase n=1 Tax=Kibdelosporangium phytohabitans TaxID=860235 RepID=A0A0N9I756_9PSEU|nr:threonine/serine dehydratase [Kibdelosporangium phytohabitans]ALG11934.1 threonine dehydratase [Kibdelosporangium phytohabitans]MBE1463388.1 threonine dehydratase [Kibdelosporangium phytohabitans]